MTRRITQFHVVPIPGELAAAKVFAWPPVAATCCDGHMTAHLVNRDGRTHCADCDWREQEAKRKEQEYVRQEEP